MRVKDLMTRLPFQLHEHDTLRTALSYMQESKLNTLPVIREDRTLFGVVTRSIMYRAILQDVPLDTPIASYIRRDAITLTDDTPYNQVVEMVQQSDVGTGIVVDQGNRVEGLFTKTDMIMYLLKSSTVLREQLETLLGSIELGILMIDHAGEIMYANTAFKQLMKQSQHLTGEVVQQILPTMDWQSILRDPQIPAPQKLAVGELQILVQFSRFSTISNQQGIIAVYQELTHLETIAHELKTVRNLHQLLDTVLEHAYDGIVMIDSTGKINFLSQVMCELFGTSQEVAMGQPVERIFPSFQLPVVLQTGIAEMSDVLEINGIQYLIHRIPIQSDKNIVGAIGKVMFRQLKEVREVAKRLDQLESEVAYYKEQLKKHTSTKFTWDHIISNNPQIERLKRIANQASKGQSTIMLRGDSGTGKELFAHAIHASSNRKNGPFITINCAAIPDQLLESELFGYESGAFTGADRAGKRGKFDLANGGTLFLDEIGDMSPHLQAKLLRVLQEREFYRVGGSERIEVDVRIIAATHKPLEDLVESGHFRQDLYYRLHVISLEIPPLRDRKEDILHLANHFIQELNTQMGTSILGLAPEVEQLLLSYSWPGNIRELRNVMERAMTFAEHGKIQTEDLPDLILNQKRQENHVGVISEAGLSMKNRQQETEKEMILAALTQTNGNRSLAAKTLGMSRSTFYEKCNKYQLL